MLYYQECLGSISDAFIVIINKDQFYNIYMNNNNRKRIKEVHSKNKNQHKNTNIDDSED